MTKETDRELLELAAKAAGFGDPEKGRVTWTESEYPPKSGKYGALWNFVGYMDTAQLWNPLTDDGDALRLAVKLGITLELHPRWVYARAVISIHSWSVIEEGWGNGGDPNAATRRAIVRAAAEIGRAMP